MSLPSHRVTITPRIGLQLVRVQLCSLRVSLTPGRVVQLLQALLRALLQPQNRHRPAASCSPKDGGGILFLWYGISGDRMLNPNREELSTQGHSAINCCTAGSWRQTCRSLMWCFRSKQKLPGEAFVIRAEHPCSHHVTRTSLAKVFKSLTVRQEIFAEINEKQRSVSGYKRDYSSELFCSAACVHD